MFLILSFDWLLVRDFNNTQAQAVGTKLCGKNIPQPIIGSGNALYLEFHSDEATEQKGFQLKVKEV